MRAWQHYQQVSEFAPGIQPGRRRWLRYGAAVRLSVEPSLDAATYPFHHRIRVRFAETDAMGIVHHAAYLPYLESARVEYMREIGRAHV